MAARGKAIDMQEVQQRAALQMVNEAMHCLGAEQVVDQLKCLRDRLGLRFEPAPALVKARRYHRKFSD